MLSGQYCNTTLRVDCSIVLYYLGVDCFHQSQHGVREQGAGSQRPLRRLEDEKESLDSQENEKKSLDSQEDEKKSLDRKYEKKSLDSKYEKKSLDSKYEKKSLDSKYEKKSVRQ